MGAEDRLFHAGWRADEPFRFLFVGKLIPLHGLETILEAARLAPELPIRLIGSGQLNEAMEGRPENVEWMHWVDYEALPDEYWGAGCALGIFGTSDKALRVIPNKAFQALACGTPLITADTPGARELLVDGESACSFRPETPRLWPRRCDGWRTTRSWPGGSALGEGRSTRRKRARRCSAPGGGR